MAKIASLYVKAGGVYFNDPEIDPWDITRDARLYDGPFPVIAHPPCERWGRYWFGGPSAKVRQKKGDDGGCFEAALACVRKWGGVLEHPEASHAWAHFSLNRPKWREGWIEVDEFGGFTCCVFQGQYGHRARKATWLYACGIPRENLPELNWEPIMGLERLDQGFPSTEVARAVRRDRRNNGQVENRLSRAARIATPPAFREVLIDIAKRVNR